jgi:hypothetical protein
MSQELVIGKRYKLKFYEDDLEDQTDLVAISRSYEFIGNGTILYGEDNSKKFEYLLFRNRKGKVVEVFKDGNSYMSLMFCRGDKLVTANFSDYLEPGDEEFPEFGGNEDICVNVKIKEYEE